MAQRLDLAIKPMKGLGWFNLGMSLWDTIRLLRDQAALIPVVDLKYCEEDPFAADIVLRLKSNGIELRFEPYSQRLKLIIVDDFQRVRLTYGGNEVSSSKAVPTGELVNKLFGPTIPGEFDSSMTKYTLTYPGLSLVFPIPGHMLTYQTSPDVPMEFPDGGTPFASHMYIYCGETWLKPVLPSLPRPAPHGGRSGDNRGEVERVVAQINYGVVIQFAGGTHKCSIQFHVTTPQDLLADLGPPGSIYYKEEDKMQIHADFNNEASKAQQEDDGIMGTMDGIGYDRSDRPAQGSQQPKDYFYNYFHLGIDVLFNGSSHRCKKIVMHTNIPGHFDFQSYKRCPYVLQPASASMGPTMDSTRSPQIAPQLSHSVPPPPAAAQAPVHHQNHHHQMPETTKAGKKKSRNSAAVTAVNEALEPSQLSYFLNGEGARGSHDIAGSSSMPVLPSSELEQMRISPQQQQSGGLIPISPEKGITPDMKMSMIMALLDISTPASAPDGTSENATNNPDKQGMVYQRGSATQDPFLSTRLYGTDGVVFEATQTGYVATITLY
ncbi:hypothetical protein BGX34_000610 [Mortierella sp. NVP85]|nr:hypothetical protein BGX34_000610 [Mortierella sp. NVP85]